MLLLFLIIHITLRKHLLHTKVKKSLYKPGKVLRVPRDWGSQTIRPSAHEGGKVDSTTHWLPGRIMSMKNSSDTIENRNRLWLLAQSLNQQRHHATPMYSWLLVFFTFADIIPVFRIFNTHVIINLRCFVYNMHIELWLASKTSFTGSRITTTTPKDKGKFRRVAILLITLYKSVTIIKASCVPYLTSGRVFHAVITGYSSLALQWPSTAYFISSLMKIG